MNKFLMLIIISLIPSINFAENSIRGRVVDVNTKQPIYAVSVTLLDNDQKPIQGVLTSENGYYQVNDIDPGTYSLRFSLIGYRTLFKNRIVVRPNIATYLEVELEEQLLTSEGITVRPDFFEKPEDVVVSSRSMDFEEIISQPGGAYDVQRAVQALPAVVSGADQNNEIIVRGGNYGENLFLIDNIEILNPNHFGWQGTGGGPVSVLNTDFISQIDFIAGAFPAKYGDKTSSVLNIQMREGARDRFHVKFDLGMAGIGGTLEGPFASNLTYLISAHRSYLSLIASSFGLTAIPNYYNVQGKIAYQISNNHKVSLLGIYADDWITIEADEAEEETRESEVKIIEAKSSQYTLGLNLKSIYDFGHSNLTVYRTINFWDHYLEDTSNQEVYHHRSNEGENSVKFDLSIIFNRYTNLSFGLFGKNVEHFYDSWMRPDTLFIYDSSGQIIDTTDYIYTLDIDRDESSWKYGGYIQLRQHLGTFASVNVGCRYDYFAYTEKGYLSPRAAISFHILDGTDINLAYGRHYQSPQWYELVLDSQNHYIHSKYTDQIVLGLEHLLSDDIKLTVEGYYKYYQQVAIARSWTTADPNDWDNVYVNQGEGYARGIEVFLQKKVMRNFWGTFSYSYSVARANDPRESEREYSWDFDYGNVLTVIGGYRQDFTQFDWYSDFKSSWWYKLLAFIPLMPSDISEYTLKFRYLGGKPYTPETWHYEWKTWTVDGDQLINSDRMAPYQRFDIMISQRWFFNRWNLKTYFEVENLFNHPNVWDYLYKDNGERETIYQFGRMVIGGVIVEF